MPTKWKRDDASDPYFFRGFPDTPAVDAHMAFVDDMLGDGAALHQPDEEQEAVDPQRRSLLLELGQFGEGMAAAVDAIGAMSAAAAPPPGVARFGEADVVHQQRERLLAKPDRDGELAIDRIVAARRTDFSRMACEAVGEVDPEPAACQAAIGERRPARVGFGAEGCGTGRGQRRHGQALLHGEQGGTPTLSGRLQQGAHEDVEGAQADAQPVKRLPVGLLEVSDGADAV